MATSARPLVSVKALEGDMATDSAGIPMPHVFRAPIRPDVVRFTHKLISCNSRQPYAVSTKAGHQTSAESWGTGRAVNIRLCRVAVASALVATAVPSLVLARGHRIEFVPEFPLVVSDSAEGVEKTAHAIKVLKQIGAYADAEKAKDSVGIRPGVGQSSRGRRVGHVASATGGESPPSDHGRGIRRRRAGASRLDAARRQAQPEMDALAVAWVVVVGVDATVEEVALVLVFFDSSESYSSTPA